MPTRSPGSDCSAGAGSDASPDTDAGITAGRSNARSLETQGFMNTPSGGARLLAAGWSSGNGLQEYAVTRSNKGVREALTARFFVP